MKMKRIFAMLLAMVMVFAMVTGCSKKANKESNDNSDPSASVVQTITIKADGIEGMSADVTLTLKGVNGASTMSVNGSFSAEGEKIDLNFDEVLTIVKDKVYVNVEEIMTVVESVTSMNLTTPDVEGMEGMAGLDGFDIESITSMFDSEWIYLEMPGMSDAVKIDTTLQDKLIASIKNEMSSLAKVEGDSTTYKLETADDYKAAMSAIAKAMKDNRDAWVDFSYTSATSVDIEKMMEGIVDSMAEVMAEMYAGMVTKEQLKEQLMASVDTSEMEINKEDIEATVDEMIETIEEAADEMEFEEIGMITEVKTTDKANGYTFSVKMQPTEDEGSIEISADVTTGTAVSIKEPSGAKNVMDMISELMTQMGGMMGELQ